MNYERWREGANPRYAGRTAMFLLFLSGLLAGCYIGQKYGMMSGFGTYGMTGIMRGGFGNNMRGNFGNADVSAEMTVTPEQAVEAAQTYLSTYFSETGLTADEHADPFYGYYTLHVNRDGETVGMLSVNGFTGQVFPHTWHGRLLEMSGE